MDNHVDVHALAGRVIVFHTAQWQRSTQIVYLHIVSQSVFLSVDQSAGRCDFQFEIIVRRFVHQSLRQLAFQSAPRENQFLDYPKHRNIRVYISPNDFQSGSPSVCPLQIIRITFTDSVTTSNVRYILCPQRSVHLSQ